MDETTGVLEHAAVWGWLAALAILPLFALVGIALHARHRARLLDPNMPPLRDREAVARIYDVRSLEARRGWLPESFTYSPRYTNRGLEVEEEPTPNALPPLGSVDDLLSYGRGVAYGYRVDTGEVFADDRVRSLLVGGVQGSGKTSFVALVAAQLARTDARIFLADPDALNHEGLVSRLHGLGVQPEDTAHEPPAVLRLVLNAQHELMNRKGRGDPRPYVLIVDELPECLRVLNDYDTNRLRSALELIGGFSGRKHGVVTIMLAQSWMRSVVGSTAIRNLIPASAVFRMRSDEARAMTGLRADYWSADPMDLELGTFFAVGIDSGAVKVRVPALPPTRAHAHTRAASEMASEWRPNGVPTASTQSPVALPGRDLDAVSDQLDAETDAIVDAVLAGFHSGQGLTAAIRATTGLRPGGRQYEHVRSAVEAALRGNRLSGISPGGGA